MGTEGGAMKYEKVTYNNNYNKEHYDEIKIRVPKGMKEKIKETAKYFDFSTNFYIQAMLIENLSLDKKEQFERLEKAFQIAEQNRSEKQN